MTDWTEAFWAVQVTETYKTEPEARQGLDFQKQAEGFIAGRLIPPSGRGWWWHPETPDPTEWKFQALFEDCGAESANHLPDGMRRVLVLPCMKSTFNVRP